MSSILRQSDSLGKGKIIIPNIHPTAIAYNEGNPNKIFFSDGAQTESSCLRCHDAPCMKFSSKETSISDFLDFPADRSEYVCGAGAISRSSEAGAPKFNNSLCVHCGVCVARCPVGALQLVPGKGVLIEDKPNSHFIETPINSEAEMLANRNLFTGIERKGIILTESDFLIDDIQKRLITTSKIVGDQFTNLLVCSLLRTVGVNTTMRRKGNNNMRMDFIIKPLLVKYGVAEAEFGYEAILNVPRDIMDDVAVLISRYGWVKKNIVALIVSDSLPNKRSEYWEIIQDIDKVLDIKIGTISIFALMLAVWNRLNLTLDTKNTLFYTDRNSGSYRKEVLERIIGRPLKLSQKPCSFVEPAK